ncbi:unnamed protein product [Arctogadus glacialis]
MPRILNLNHIGAKDAPLSSRRLRLFGGGARGPADRSIRGAEIHHSPTGVSHTGLRCPPAFLGLWTPQVFILAFCSDKAVLRPRSDPRHTAQPDLSCSLPVSWTVTSIDIRLHWNEVRPAMAAQKPLHSTMTQLWPSPSHYGYDHHHHHPSGTSLTLYATAGRKTLDSKLGVEFSKLKIRK